MFFRKKISSTYLIALGVIILIEVLFCNSLFFRNIWNEPIPYYLPEDAGTSIILNNLSLTNDGKLFVENAQDAYLEIDNLNIDGRSLYIGLCGVEWLNQEIHEHSVDFRIETIDESHPEFYNRAGNTTTSALMEQTKYKSLRQMGNLQALRIRLANVNDGDVVHIDQIVLNCKRPLFFSPVRVLVFFILFLMFYHLRKGSPLYEIYYDDRVKWQRRTSFTVLIVLLLVLFHITGFLTQGSKMWYKNPYDLLAHSMAHGQVNLDLDQPADESLLAVADPYVPSNRVGAAYSWDCAFYEGKYYVYYGVVPEILFYLPHYLLTGKDFGITTVGRLEMELFIIGIFLGFLELGNRYNGRIPYVTWLLLFLATVGGLQAFLLAKQMLFYHIPVIMGCALLVWGLYFWISSSRNGGKDYSIPRITAGSICMAMTVGCRPQMIFGSLLAFPVFFRYFTENEKKDRTLKKTGAYLCAGGLPFVIILGLLFYYNAIRFGSPFEFGAQYNLTSIDVTRVEANMGKLVPGLFWYLLVPPAVTTVFPFIQNVSFTSSYTGDFFALLSNGGFMICNPLTFFVIGGLTNRDLFKNRYQKGLFYTCLAVTVLILWTNIMMGGFMMRYFCDFSPFVHLACLIVICQMLETFDARGRGNLVPVLSALCVVTVFYHYLSYYVGEPGAFFCKFDREVFLRASLVWQWWE